MDQCFKATQAWREKSAQMAAVSKNLAAFFFLQPKNKFKKKTQQDPFCTRANNPTNNVSKMNNYRRLLNTLTVAIGYNILTNLNYTVYKVCTPRTRKPTQRRSFLFAVKSNKSSRDQQMPSTACQLFPPPVAINIRQLWPFILATNNNSFKLIIAANE